MRKELKFTVGLACIFVVSCFFVFSAFSPAFNQWEQKSIAKFFMDEGWRQLAATNTVTTIVWEYRGYDTLGEETILFTAAMGVFALGLGFFSAEKLQQIEREKAGEPPSVKGREAEE